MSHTAYKLRPGLLVSLNTSMHGNVRYSLSDIEYERDGKREKRKGISEREIADTAEHEKGKQVRSAATYTVKKLCTATLHGLMCPVEDRAKLEAAIKDAENLVATFNDEAKVTTIGFHVAIGTMEPGDLRMLRSVQREIASLVRAMDDGIRAKDADAIRDAAVKAKAIAAMLETSDSKTELIKSVSRAREAATSIAKTGYVPKHLRPADVETAEVKPTTAAEPAPATSEPAPMSEMEAALAALQARKRAAKAKAQEEV